MILTVHNRELVLSRYQATQLCLNWLSFSVDNATMKMVSEGQGGIPTSWCKPCWKKRGREEERKKG